jgi:hypothetical protein
MVQGQVREMRKEYWLAVAVQAQLRSQLARNRSRGHRLHSRELDLKLKGRRKKEERKKERGRGESCIRLWSQPPVGTVRLTY